MMRPKPVLNEVHQNAPDRERNISGLCSSCGDTLLAWLDVADANPTPDRLRAKLDRVFEQHLAESHPDNATSSAAAVGHHR
jgi:hypothetical protein